MTAGPSRRPRLLAVARLFYGFLGVFGALWTVLAAPSLARWVFGDGPYRIDGELVSKARFLSVALPSLVLIIIGVGLAALASWALHVGLPRSRRYLIALFALPLLAPFQWIAMGLPSTSIAWGGVAGLGLFACSWLYLYRKPNVIQYYHDLTADIERDRVARLHPSSEALELSRVLTVGGVPSEWRDGHVLVQRANLSSAVEAMKRGGVRLERIDGWEVSGSVCRAHSKHRFATADLSDKEATEAAMRTPEFLTHFALMAGADEQDTPPAS